MKYARHPGLYAVTGSIGTGKSSAIDLIQQQGHHVFSADFFAKKVVAPSGSAYPALRLAFPQTDLWLKNGELNRAAMRKHIQQHKQAKKHLEEITHPAIQYELQRCIEELPESELIFYEIPLLFEVKADIQYKNRIILVCCTPEIQLQRLLARGGMSEAEAKKFIEIQIPVEEKIPKSDFVLYNNKDIKDLSLQVDQLLKKLKEQHVR